MTNYKDIDYETVNNLFYYDETSETFLRWKVSRGNKKAGDIAGCDSTGGYYRVSINNSDYMVHRIIWVLFHGEIDSSLTIDHIDRNRRNNNIKNLCLATQLQNISNRGYKLRANGLPTNIYYDKKRPRDSLGRDYLRAQITNPITKKKISKCGYDLDTLLLWLEEKREEFKKSIN